MSLRGLFYFYYDGFKNMGVGKTLWKIILIKLVVILLFLKCLVWDKSFKTEYKTPQERADFVYKNIRLNN